MKEPEKKIEYHEDGKTICREYYVNKKGHKHGPYKWCRENGQIGIELTYVNGKINGIYKGFDESVRLDIILQAKKGNTHGILIGFEY